MKVSVRAAAVKAKTATSAVRRWRKMRAGLKPGNVAPTRSPARSSSGAAISRTKAKRRKISVMRPTSSTVFEPAP